MTTRTKRMPGPDHPITIEASTSRVVVKVGGETIADTRHAVILREANYAPVFYIPREDAQMSTMRRTDHMTYCPYKGECAYLSIPAGGGRSVNAVWTYEKPYEAVAEIRGFLAFYPDRVDSINVGD
ncbi:DUF427 domain-containing protein [Rhizobium calliandrae]|uniref:DUF427 domain-containing protein n=1 Tax=Rhizobium calliandrae TaxID=1312182 RepID=A0ABT7KE99_9HYPH|nr:MULTISPECIES: DUF427 domain-containing protein [Rhizobium]MDL2406948.1 DUF427 domain-containing protein [Rhizobium calliandrae]